MFSLFRRKQQLEAGLLATVLDASYGTDEDADKQFVLMTIELDENTLLWHKCHYKFEWTVREIRETIIDYGRLCQNKGMYGYGNKEWSDTYQSIVVRLKAHQQTMHDLQKAANQESNEIFTKEHPSNKASRELIVPTAILKIKYDSLVRKSAETTGSRELLRALRPQLLRVRRYLICRDPKETKRELSQLETAIEEIKHPIRK